MASQETNHMAYRKPHVFRSATWALKKAVFHLVYWPWSLSSCTLQSGRSSTLYCNGCMSWGRRRHIDLYKLHASENISSLKLFYAAAICITKPIPKTFSFFYSILFCLSDIVLRGVDGLHHPAGCEYWGQCFRWGRVGVVTQSCLGCIWNSWVQCFRGLQVQEKEPSYLNEGLAQLHLMETT